MQIKLFNISLADEGIALAEMNKFLANHKILEVEQRFFQNEKREGWSFCVRYINSGQIPSEFANSNKKTDYKAVLGEQQFAAFSRLRELRKIIASKDAVPAYAVFTDEELANVARLPIIETSQLISIKGIGDKKVEKYGKLLVEMYHAKNSQDESG